MNDEQRDKLIIETANDGKICSACKQLKPLSAYNKHGTYKDGLNAKCNLRLGWYEKNKELDFVTKVDIYLKRRNEV